MRQCTRRRCAGAPDLAFSGGQLDVIDVPVAEIRGQQSAILQSPLTARAKVRGARMSAPEVTQAEFSLRRSSACFRTCEAQICGDATELA
jgi:hypothetical protein